MNVESTPEKSRWGTFRRRDILAIIATGIVGTFGVAWAYVATQSIVDSLLGTIVVLAVFVIEISILFLQEVDGLSSLLRQRVLPVVEVRIDMPQEDMYEETYNLVKDARKRLLIVQRTPTPMVGADETKPKGVQAKEKQYGDKVNERVQGILKNEDKIQLLYTFSFTDESFLRDVKDRFGTPEKKRALAEKILERLKQRNADRLYFFPLPKGQNAHPLIISDDSIAVWITESPQSERMYIRITKNEETADEIFNKYLGWAKNFNDSRTKTLRAFLVKFKPATQRNTGSQHNGFGIFKLTADIIKCHPSCERLTNGVV